MTVAIEELMQRSGVAFGTSGARGLASAMTDEVCSAYAEGFLAWLRGRGDIEAGSVVALGGDLRSSTERILEAVAAGAQRAGHRVRNCGLLPTPALALHGITHGIASMMVTGSHIPDDRNGIKFHTPDGEILKADEAAIRAIRVAPTPGRAQLPHVDARATVEYRRRFADAFGPRALAGLRVGVYGHSAVGRDLLVDVLEDLGAATTRLGFTDRFEAVDTEAIRPGDIALAQQWAADGRFDAIASTDGDGDRPLLADERGEWLRGDVAGILCARALQADVVVTPVSSSTAVERCGAFANVIRTKIGSPYVIEAMHGDGIIVGYEANGGFLTATPVRGPAGTLSPLPTRDAMIVIATLLHECVRTSERLSAIVASLPRRFTFSARLEHIPRERSERMIDALLRRGTEAMASALGLPPVVAIDTIDGLRLQLADDSSVHLRPSGNAPELRCYAEADDPTRARELAEATLRRVEAWP
jgi:phosphomannomutase